MRHLGSLVLSLVLAPLIWVLSGYGMSEVARTLGSASLTMLGGFAALAAAGVLLTLLTLTRLSPVGPATAGLAFIALFVWAVLEPAAFSDAFDFSLSDRPAGLVNPVSGVAPVVGVLLLLTVTDPRRWRRREMAVVVPVGPPGYQPAHAHPGGWPMPDSPVGTHATGVLYGPGSPSAPSSGPPAGGFGYPPPGPVAGRPASPAPAPFVQDSRTGAPPLTPPPPPQFTPHVPAQFTPHVPRQTDAAAAADATDATTRLDPHPPVADETTRLTPHPPATDETTRLTPRSGDEQTTVLRPEAADDDQTTLLSGRPDSGDEPTERVADEQETRSTRGTPPPPAAYPPPGHATQTPPPTDPDATRRF